MAEVTQETPAPETAAPETPALETPAPETPAPETPAPEASVPPETAPEQTAPEQTAPETAAPVADGPPGPDPEVPPAPAAPRFVGVERGRPLPSIERALSGPGSRGDASNWHRQVKVVAGGQGPGKRDQETLDRDRARLPLAAPSLIAVLGCTRGAGQTVTALMTGHILATLRGVPVATLDLNPGPTSLAARRAPAAAVQDLLAGREPRPEHRPELRAGPAQGARLDVIASMPGPSMAGHNMPGHNMAGHSLPGHSLPGHGALEGADFVRLADLMTERYSLTMIDPSPAGLTRVLAVADLLVLVAPASPDAATSLANTQQWLSAHGHGELAARAVTVVNGVSRRTKEDVLRAESVARGRCRAIVRVPWDDSLAVRPSRPSAGYPQVTAYPQVTLQPQARLAYTALAGVLAAALSASPASPVPGRNAGEHSD
jgi:MinD-like ATPase involved in chromosome partitioning or flagellar assembly